MASGVAPEDAPPPRPWHPIRATSDATTLWYAVMRKRTRGVFIGTLCLRHRDHYASLLQDGWQEVAVEEIRGPDGRADGLSTAEAERAERQT